MRDLLKIIVVLVLLMPCLGYGQYISDCPKDSIKIEHGLPSNEVYHLYQDENGYIWMATDNGVVKYSGDEIQTYTKSNGLPENVVFRLYPQKDGTIVGECKNNKYFILDQEGNITPHPLNESLGHNLDNYLFCYSYYEDSIGNYHIGSRQGYFKFDSDYQLVEEDRKRADSSRLIAYKEFDDYVLPYIIQSEFTVYGVKIVSDTNVVFQRGGRSFNSRSWYAIKWDSTIAINTGNLTVIINGNETRVLETPTVHLGVFKVGRYLWVATRGDGAYCYDIDNNYNLVDHVLEGATTTAVLKSYDDIIYIGTTSSGVHSFELNVPRLEYEAAIDNNIRIFYKDAQELIVAYENGKVWFRGELISTGNDLVISELGKVKGQYFLKGGHLYSLPEIERMDSIFPYSEPIFYTEYNEPLYETTSVSLSYLSVWKVLHDKEEIVPYKCLMPGDRFTDLVKDSNRIIVSRSNEIIEFDGIKDCIIRRHHFDENIIELSINESIGIGISDLGTMYYLTDSGVKKSKLPIQRYGLKVQSAYCENGKLYTCTNQGVYCWSLSGFDVELERFFPMADVVNVRKQNGELYIMCRKSIRKMDTTMIGVGVPNVLITDISINQLEASETDLSRLPHYLNNFKLNLVRVGKGLGIGKFRYQLIGHDPDYIYTSDGNVTYNNLPPGEYTFVYASSNDGVRYTENKEITIVIDPPYWETAWFRVIIILLGLLAIFGLFRLRVNRIRKKAELQQTIAMLKSKALAAQLNPHLIFNVLNSIQGLVSEKDEELANRYISKFSRFLRMSLNYSKENQVSLKEEIEITRAYIELERIRFGNEVEFIVHEIDHMQNYNVPPLIIQPLIENAIKHGVMPSANLVKKIEIHLEFENDVLSILVSDTGDGFKGDALGDGLRITQQRLKSFHQENELIVQLSEGPTVVKLTFKQ